jgi:type II secretory pathway component PulK
MRKPRDFDSELKALADKAKALKERRVRQLGELVVATGADVLDADVLAGALLDAAASTDAASQEGWRKRGAAFFQGKTRETASGAQRQPDGTLPLEGGRASA